MMNNNMKHFLSLKFKAKNTRIYSHSVLAGISLSTVLLFSGCSMFSVYQIDLPQGTPISQNQAQKVQVGMNKNQVLYLLGSPAVHDTLSPNRWDYIYDYTPGTHGKREGKAAIHNAKQHLSVYFGDSGRVIRIDGLDTLPSQ